MKSTRPKLFTVVPVFNEVENIPRLMESFRESARQLSQDFILRFVLVDDGSQDGTADLARSLSSGLNLLVISQSRNFGPGYAFATAFEYLADEMDLEDWIVTMEGDNTSRHELLAQMLTRSKEGFDVVLASPYLYGGGILYTNAFRVFLSHMANLFVKETLGIHGIVTMSSFYRLISAPCLKNLQSVYGVRVIERGGFESMIEMLLKLIYLKARISEVAMVLDTSRRRGKSKMKVFKTMLSYLSLWFDKSRWQTKAIEMKIQLKTADELVAEPNRL